MITEKRTKIWPNKKKKKNFYKRPQRFHANFFPKMELNTCTALQNDSKRQIVGRLSQLVLVKGMGNIQSVCVKIGQIKNNLFLAFAKESMIIFEAINMQIMVL